MTYFAFLVIVYRYIGAYTNCLNYYDEGLPRCEVLLS
jgi:hypothetical protein